MQCPLLSHISNYETSINDTRDFLAQVANPDGVNILTTPTETSVWKGRLEKDKVTSKILDQSFLRIRAGRKVKPLLCRSLSTDDIQYDGS